MDVRFKNFTGLSLGERNVVTVHFSFTGNFADCHDVISPFPY